MVGIGREPGRDVRARGWVTGFGAWRPKVSMAAGGLGVVMGRD